MFWWIVVLLLFLAWLGGFDLAGFIVLAVSLIVLLFGYIGVIDHRRRRPHPKDHYHPIS